MKIVWTRRATRHLRAAYEYWTREKSEDAADLMLDRIFSAVELLEHHSELSRAGRVDSTRELVLHPLPFILGYRVRRSKIEIIALLHGSRKWPAAFE
ncbi:MAG TPA: type II toxin-antitoxin system RelE/ParE family toxin [Terriglobales bacterium]|nr:type II toxin-antitoxin system RelE/ParE family toxin [Terriglobales bacterium]